MTDRIYTISVCRSPDGDAWIAISDDIPLATEAGSFEGLMERVLAIAPDVLAANGETRLDEIQLRFVTETPLAA